MTCPQCGSDLPILEILDKYHEVIKLHKCPHCNSFWLDQHELTRIDDEIAEDLDGTILKQENDDLARDCPRCHIPMQKAHDHKHGNIPLQICHECEGIFMQSGNLAKYFGLAPKISEHTPDKMGYFSSRDRILTSFISVVIVLFGAGLAISKQTGYGSFSADTLIGNTSIEPKLFYLFILLTIVIFLVGLILTFSKQARTVRLLGWLTILLSISLIFFLSV